MELCRSVCVITLSNVLSSYNLNVCFDKHNRFYFVYYTLTIDIIESSSLGVNNKFYKSANWSIRCPSVVQAAGRCFDVATKPLSQFYVRFLRSNTPDVHVTKHARSVIGEQLIAPMYRRYRSVWSKWIAHLSRWNVSRPLPTTMVSYLAGSRRQCFRGNRNKTFEAKGIGLWNGRC